MASLFQVAKAHNISLSEDKSIVYQVPSEKVEFDPSLMLPSDFHPGTLKSFAFDAIIGADNNHDAAVTMKDVFDVIVDSTRTVSPSCE